MVKRYKEELGIYNQSPFYIIIGSTYSECFEKDELLQELIKAGEVPDESYRGKTILAENKENGHTILLMVISVKEGNRDAIRTVIHESLHMTLMFAEFFGIRLDFNNQEPLAYLNEYIASVSLQCLEDFLSSQDSDGEDDMEEGIENLKKISEKT